MIDISNNNDDWVSFIIGIVEEFASAEFQLRVWVDGRGPEVSSFEEAVCQFFDSNVDSLLDEQWRQIGLSTDQHDSLKKFRDALRKFSDTTPPISKPRDIISHPMWPEIRALASNTLMSFRRRSDPE
ncbi:MAG: hypothetical protein F8N15_08505 [Methanobacterium sp.]|nr:hypothetical protein [Methanobacterium sp.]